MSDSTAKRRVRGGINPYISAAPSNFVRDAIESSLAADHVDESRIAALAAREYFGDAAKMLVRVVHPSVVFGSTLVGSLFAPPSPPMLVMRVALHMEVMPHSVCATSTQRLKLLSIAGLRGFANGKNAARALLARTALALLGEPCAAYSRLSQRERAAVLLRLLVAARRECVS